MADLFSTSVDQKGGAESAYCGYLRENPTRTITSRASRARWEHEALGGINPALGVLSVTTVAAITVGKQQSFFLDKVYDNEPSRDH